MYPAGEWDDPSDMTDLLERRSAVTTALSATFVLGIEARQGSLSYSDFQVCVQRLQRAVRPWDSVVELAPRTVGVLCTAVSHPREVDAIAARLAEVVRAPMAVGEEVHEVGVCVGSSVVGAGETAEDAFARAREAMRRMRAARASMVEPEVPPQR